MNRVLWCLVACVLAAHVSTLLAAASGADAPRNQVASATYLRAVIESLVRSHLALKAVNDSAQLRSLVDRMTAIQNATIELGISKDVLRRFASSENENLSLSAQSIMDAYGIMQKSLSMTLALYEKLDAAKSEDDLAGMRRQISDAKVLYQQASAMLVEATTLAFMSGVVPDPKDPENHVALSMSAAEKTELIKVLESRFGSGVRTKTQDDGGPLKAGQALLKMLEKQWAHATQLPKAG